MRNSFFKLCLFFIVCGLPHIAAAQYDDDYDVYTLPEHEAEFPGGIEALYKFIGENIRYPDTAREYWIEGKVIVEFSIDTEGSVQNIKVEKDIGGGCGKEVVRVLELMPKWEPARTRGKAVEVEGYQLPVSFKLAGEESPCPDVNLRQMAKEGDAAAQYNYAKCLYEHGAYKPSLYWFSRSGTEGYVFVGKMYYEKHKYKNAEKWLLKAAKYNSDARSVLVKIYLEQNDFENAEKWLVESARRDPDARSILVKYYLEHNNLDKADYWASDCLKDGVYDNADTLAKCYFKQGNYEKTVYWLTKDLANYRGETMEYHKNYILGLKYEYGIGVEKNINTAIQWYEKAKTVDEAEAALKRLKKKK